MSERSIGGSLAKVGVVAAAAAVVAMELGFSFHYDGVENVESQGMEQTAPVRMGIELAGKTCVGNALSDVSAKGHRVHQIVVHIPLKGDVTQDYRKDTAVLHGSNVGGVPAPGRAGLFFDTKNPEKTQTTEVRKGKDGKDKTHLIETINFPGDRFFIDDSHLDTAKGVSVHYSDGILGRVANLSPGVSNTESLSQNVMKYGSFLAGNAGCVKEAILNKANELQSKDFVDVLKDKANLLLNPAAYNKQQIDNVSLAMNTLINAELRREAIRQNVPEDELDDIRGELVGPLVIPSNEAQMRKFLENLPGDQNIDTKVACVAKDVEDYTPADTSDPNTVTTYNSPNSSPALPPAIASNR